MIKSIVAVGLIALGAAVTGAGIAAAEEVQVEGNYATLAACQADGPSVQVDKDNSKWTAYDCRQGGDGLYYLYLSN